MQSTPATKFEARRASDHLNTLTFGDRDRRLESTSKKRRSIGAKQGDRLIYSGSPQPTYLPDVGTPIGCEPGGQTVGQNTPPASRLDRGCGLPCRRPTRAAANNSTRLMPVTTFTWSRQNPQASGDPSSTLK